MTWYFIVFQLTGGITDRSTTWRHLTSKSVDLLQKISPILYLLRADDDSINNKF